MTHESRIRNHAHLSGQHGPARARPALASRHERRAPKDGPQYHGNFTARHERATIGLSHGDQGSDLPRSRRWPFDSDLRAGPIPHIPLRFRSLSPAACVFGGESERLVGFVHLAPTVLSLAGIRSPECTQGRAFLGPWAAAAPTFQFGFRGRMNEHVEMVRSARSARYVYGHHSLPHRIYGHHIAYLFEPPTTRVWTDQSERRTVEHRRAHERREKETSRADTEVFVLRNLSRGQRIGCFHEQGFDPDFILWVTDDCAQRIVFIEPHGMLHAEADVLDGKVGLHDSLPGLAKAMEIRTGLKNVAQESFSVSATAPPARTVG